MGGSDVKRAVCSKSGTKRDLQYDTHAHTAHLADVMCSNQQWCKHFIF